MMRTICFAAATLTILSGAAIAQGGADQRGATGIVGEKTEPAPKAGPANRPSIDQGRANAPGQPAVPGTSGVVGDKLEYEANKTAHGAGSGGTPRAGSPEPITGNPQTGTTR
ncbi:MAG: hypothetical protein NW215_05845 [Hyphomicrobiales bacterium]|nr:hypothetical protein [Hyphomicrobiales bacterium]